MRLFAAFWRSTANLKIRVHIFNLGQHVLYGNMQFTSIESNFEKSQSNILYIHVISVQYYTHICKRLCIIIYNIFFLNRAYMFDFFFLVPKEGVTMFRQISSFPY